MTRNLAFRELVNLMKLKLIPSNSSDLCLIAGDFNVYKSNMSPQLAKSLKDKDARWTDFFSVIDSEYLSLLEILSDSGKFEIVDIWDRDNKGKKCISIG